MTVSGSSKVTLASWPKYTSDKHILLHSDSLLTVMEPTNAIRDAYLKKIGKTMEDFTPEPQPELLKEDEHFTDGESVQPPDFDDEYEPRYQEY